MRIPSLARHIEIHPDRIVIDGAGFPWHVASDGVSVSVGDDTTLHTVTLAVIAETITVSDRPWRPAAVRRSSFRPMDIAAETARLDSLGRRIAESRRCHTLAGR